MTTLVIEQFAAPDSDRAIRRLELTRRRAADELAGRTVWCVSSVPASRRAADALRRRLRALPDDGLASRGIRMRQGQTLTRVTESGDELLGSEVRAGDVVVLHDPVAAALADAVRARGAHAIWWLPMERLDDAADEAWARADCTRPRVDAYLTAWQRRGPGGADPGERGRVHVGTRRGVRKVARDRRSAARLRPAWLDEPAGRSRLRRPRRARRGKTASPPRRRTPVTQRRCPELAPMRPRT